MNIEQTPKRTAFVTGGGSGIGLAIVERLASDGYRVVALDLSEERLDTAATRLRAAGHDVVGRVVDVCDRDAVAAALDSEPRVDAMITAAGIYQDAAFDALTVDDVKRMLDINVIGTFLPAQEAARRMGDGGRIVTISSRGALGGTRFAHYVASKAAVIGLTRAMAMELKPRGIAVNSVAPGFTDTPMTRSAPSEMQAAWQQIETTGHAADPSEIAHSVAFLAAANTTFITGQTLFVDGGKSLGGLGI